ncbi:hypothetical protein GCM10010964_21930 [Caldovatus sediminis]|uniref:Cellulase-like protein n=1 Tax=Caldovatus sediminis TaxID=2041189 RepID=A0A8J2ZBV3_9PROT|nr:DUF2155 domain-containing protein [Caldovatus sediminis]GGG33629.1 hypothetical protein GCM10010964_21930 [Caldovatus sediminis]
MARGRGALRITAAATLALAAARGDAAAQDWVPRATAQLQALDKVTARVSVFEARVGEPARFDTLTIVVRACHARPPEEVPDAAAWMEIADSRAPAGSPPAFRGWMFANAPGVHMLEHPVYDIRVLACR